MLRDSKRTKWYANAILENKHLFKGKVVFDIGAGSGILSMLAAKAGAETVYALEPCEAYYMLQKNVEDNELV